MEMQLVWCIRTVMALLMGSALGEEIGTISQFPEQFSARLEVTAHLVDRTKGYPPWLRTMYITYDRPAGRAKVVVNDGVDAGKTFLRLYQQKKEYMIREGEFAGCRRSYLGEAMPIPQLPITATFEGVVLLEGAYCEHWLQDDSMSRVHIYIDRASQVPRRLTEEAAVTGDVDVPLVTYEFRDIVVGPPVRVQIKYDHSLCISIAAAFGIVSAFRRTEFCGAW